MCFLAVLMLKRMIDETIFANLLRGLGFRVEIRDGVVEAWRDSAEIRARVEGDRLDIETDDYGPQCMKDYERILRGLIELDLDPKVIYFKSPYVYAYEKKRGKTKKLLESLDLEAEEVYSGRCG